MKAIILNYINCTIDVAHIPDDVENTEEYLSIQYGYHLEDMSYMVSQCDEIPVYPVGCDELTATPIAVL